ncbi:hypothetical protein ACFQ4K_02340 [Tistrella bauzanensis]
MAGAVRRMLAAETGDILAFLPGTGRSRARPICWPGRVAPASISCRLPAS